MTPERFFNEAVPQLVARQGALFSQLQGRVVFAVADHGAWTICLGDSQSPVRQGAEEAPDLSLFFTDEAFARLLDNALDFEQAIARKAVGFQGNLGLLEKLGFMLSVGGNADSVQVSQVPLGMKRV